jgi:transcriptional regulator GlxA family with amidase domain
VAEPQLRHSAAERALQVLTIHPDEPWSVRRLAEALGLSPRTLHRTVRGEAGLPPMSLLRRARLVRARSALNAPHPEATVTRVALDCGFTHLGRFSSAYRRHFGELPSQTLARSVGGRERLPAPG